ncbi:hypothetical protein llg_34110 [Luteolibacter sp. LG18]|nr:hypothetical protein llg_34110 [Luteolibacter sp. LG18]
MIFGLAILGVLSSGAMLLGFVHPPMLLLGLPLFIIFVRGVWMTATQPNRFVFSIDEHEITWGQFGKERTLPIEQVRRFHWNDSDGFNFCIITKQGERIPLYVLETVLSYQSRPALLEFLRTAHPDLEIEGCVTADATT